MNGQHATVPRAAYAAGKHLRAVGLIGVMMPLAAQADFVADSQLNLGLRNFYVDRDFKGEKREPLAMAAGARAWTCVSHPVIPRARSRSVSMPPRNTPIAWTAAQVVALTVSCPTARAHGSKPGNMAGRH